ncbi:MAG TPA: DNA-directed DNA polymerase II small subunit [Candidatus Nanoarchaeia archaeon]|nr:DNA-directed DNA polymerase II small subunit [Candidatus Nanoarchaeia archaeon]
MEKNPQKQIEDLFKKGFLLQEDLINAEAIEQTVIDKIKTEADLLVLNKDYLEVIRQQTSLVDWYEIDGYKVEAEKERNDELYQNSLQQLRKSNLDLIHAGQTDKQDLSSLELSLNYEDGLKKNRINGLSVKSSPYPAEELGQESIAGSALTPENELSGLIFNPSQPDSAVTIIISYENKPKKYVVDDFVKIFRTRLRFLEKILQHRLELQNTLSISRVLSKKERENVSLIGLVDEIGETKNGNLIVTLEDLTGRVKIFISKAKKELYLDGKDLVLDEVVGVNGVCGDKIVFAEKIIWPDIPNTHKLKKGEQEEYVIFLSDIHVGSTLFLKEEFGRLLSWIKGDFGNEQHRKIAEKIKYIFIAGDLVDGVGIYPSQEEELEIKDIGQQYKEFSRLIGQIPLHIQIIICPGNHDVVHLAEPQPAFYQRFAEGLFNLPNVKLVTNPSLINIGKTSDFSGFDVLMYHGFSFDYYVANVESIRAAGGYHRSDLIMKFLLKRRHLAPSFRSTPYYPSHDEDPLLIKSVPDFLITGHIHYSCVANYNGITMISGSCWQAKTSFQEKLGHEPEPARVPVVNLKTREIKILRFS